MSRLINTRTHKTLSENVIKAESFSERSIGLMGKKDFDLSKTLWIKSCNWIHTFFVKFPIDVIYVDQNLVVKRVDYNISPWRLPLPSLKAKSVFEFKSQNLLSHDLKIGDQLNVVD